MTPHLETIPQTIPFSSIVFGNRARKEYNNVEALAESIAERGTEVPIILSPLPDGRWLLEGGGRRYRALETLGTTELFYASCSIPGKPGFVVKNRITTTEDHALTELLENLHRENFTWQEELELIVKAWRAKKREADLAGAKLYYATFGKMLGNYGHSDINAAVNVYDAVMERPEDFADCKSILHAYKVMIERAKAAVQKELVSRTMGTAAPVVEKAPTDALDALLLSPDPLAAPPASEGSPIPVTVDLSSRFKLCNSLDWMDQMASDCTAFDHIICDPDFAVSTERLEASVSGASAGVAQASVEDSLADLRRFLRLAFPLCRNYCIFWYDLDHHEKLQTWATEAGFRVQRWPIIWHKTDYRSNAAPSHNFCKNIEYAMVCAKPSATLAAVQMTSVLSMPSGTTTKEFSHPFAKPPTLWQRLYTAVATPGQTTFDPFCGSGSSAIAALRSGLVPSGGELSSSHFDGLLLNLQEEYRRMHGPHTLFK